MPKSKKAAKAVKDDRPILPRKDPMAKDLMELSGRSPMQLDVGDRFISPGLRTLVTVMDCGRNRRTQERWLEVKALGRKHKMDLRELGSEDITIWRPRTMFRNFSRPFSGIK